MRIQLAFTALACALLVGCESSSTTSSTTTKPPSTTVQKPPLSTKVGSDETADNTGVNKRDRDTNAKTPINQDEDQADVDRTAAIRKRVLEIKDLSVDGRNVKIITQKGKVTLRGPVDSEAERDQIEAIAKELTGPENVDCQLEVAEKKK
jgi:osmotically-inducible protein OsmY